MLQKIKSKGFTLLEVCLAIVISMIIIMVMIMPVVYMFLSHDGTTENNQRLEIINQNEETKEIVNQDKETKVDIEKTQPVVNKNLSEGEFDKL